MVDLTLVEDASPYYDDLDDLVARNKDDFIVPEAHYDGPTHIPPEDRPVPDGFLDNYRNDHESVLLAHDGETLAGFVSFGFNYTRDDFPFDTPCVYISLAIIDHEYRRKGVGSQMIDHLLSEVFPDRVTNEEFLLCRTWDDGDEARLRFYEQAGFWPYATEEDDRGSGVDSVWLVRTTESIRYR